MKAWPPSSISIGTLAESKTDLDGERATLLARLLGIVDVAIISGGAWEQFEKQVLAFLRGRTRTSGPSQCHLL